jgi:hypothetical protein
MLKTASSVTNAVGALNYKGSWNASTNVPTLVSGVGNKGDYYVVSVAGNTNLDGQTLWSVGDIAAFNGTIWQKIEGGDVGLFSSLTVTTLNGYMYGNGSNVVTASATIPVANVTGAVANTTTINAGGLLSGGGNLASNVTITLSNVPVANVPGAVPNTVNVLAGGLLTGGGALTGNVTLSLTSVPFANVTGYGTMATQNSNAVTITGGTVDNVTIGGTTAAAGTFTTMTANSTAQFGRASANYAQIVGSATGNAVIFSTLGSDANVSVAIQPKGTGAIDLAAGSSGVNISNGGTVTALTRTAAGSGYTSFPSIAISAPTTAGGVQATAVVARMYQSGVTIQSGGTGYTVGDTISAVGGTPASTAAQFTVSSVSGGVITAIAQVNQPVYTVLPTNPVSVTGGTGTGATLNLTWSLTYPEFTITNAGSGYVEQPTVSFSGGGGSGAAAYATVGSGTVVKSIGSTMSFYSPEGEAFRTQGTSGQTSAAFWIAYGHSITPILRGNTGSPAIQTVGTGSILFQTNSGFTQAAIAHTASAVNYVQVTGGASGSPGTVTISAQGSSTDVDMALTPRGAGVLKFGTYTASALLPVAGYISIKDSGGTTRKLLVG